jgi:hypothetical protein
MFIKITKLLLPIKVIQEEIRNTVHFQNSIEDDNSCGVEVYSNKMKFIGAILFSLVLLTNVFVFADSYSLHRDLNTRLLSGSKTSTDGDWIQGSS